MRLLLLICFALLASSVRAQTLQGSVLNSETDKPLYHVTLINLTTDEHTITDSLGKYLIHAKAGDTISFSLSGYHSVRHYAVPGIPLIVHLRPLSVNLPAYVKRDYTPFQRDSAQMTYTYSKVLNQKPVKVGWSSANGGGMSGLIGAPIQKISRSYRQNKRFKENFEKDMEEKYVETRYTPALVNSLTSLSGDTLLAFMGMYPMEYKFARYGSDLEIKIWIRENYKTFKSLPSLPSMYFDSTGGKK